MRVTFYGVRGSVPTPGPSTVRYGGNTSCVEVRLADGSILVLDAGTGIRELGKILNRSKLPDVIHLLVTHSHWDHIIGAPFFGPLWRKDANVRIYTFSDTAFDRFSGPVLFDGEHFPVQYDAIPATLERVHEPSGKLRIGSAMISRVALNHPGGSDGFRIDDDGGASMCFLTDNELRPPGEPRTSLTELAKFASGAGLVIHDAQYLPQDMPLKHGWGHSLVGDVLELAKESETARLALYHHEPERADDDLDVIDRDAKAWAAAKAPALDVRVAREGDSIDVD